MQVMTFFLLATAALTHATNITASITSTNTTTATMIAAQAGESPGPQGPIQWFNPRHKNTGICGPSSFVSHPSIASPYSADCAALAEQMLSRDNYGWYIARLFPSNTTLVHLATSGTCTFGIRPAHEEDLDEWQWYIGNHDMADLLADVVADHAAEPEQGVGAHVGASGMVHCKIRDARIDVAWSVYDVHQAADAGVVVVPPPPENDNGASLAGRSVARVVAWAGVVTMLLSFM